MKIGVLKPKPVKLYVFRNAKGEILAATFSIGLRDAMVNANAAKSLSLEEHDAKSATTKGMYGKLFGLSGVQSRGANALNAGMTKKQRHLRALNAVNARWEN